jgi:hypothetical membrane protein
MTDIVTTAPRAVSATATNRTQTARTTRTAQTARTTRTAQTTRTTRTLLACGIVAGALYTAVAVAQVLTRDGFDPRHHALSLLSNGPLGWIQIANFVTTGLLVVAASIGLGRALRNGRGARWGPRLVATYGVALVAAGAFVADPMNGFPRGAPDGPPDAPTWHGVLHFVSGAVGFLALIAACLILARRFAVAGRRAWAAYSAATGVVFFAAFAGIASGSGQPAINLAFATSVVLVWIWLAALCAHLRKEAS